MSITPSVLSRWSLCLLFAGGLASAQESDVAAPAVAVDAADGIIEAFRSYRIVAMAEGIGHGNEQGHAFVRALIRDPRFARVADDIVVEWGNSLYQDVIDRFTRGEDVPARELRRVWENTTQQLPVWDSPVYQEFFQAVRSQNETLPEGQHIRVLLGDPPVDWESGDPRKQTTRLFFQRDAYPAGLIRREVVEKGRRALVVYGGMHLTRLPRPGEAFVPEAAAGEFPNETIVSLLQRAGIDVFNAWGVPSDIAAAVQSEIAAWSPVRLAIIQNTPLGSAPFRSYFPGGDSTPMQEQFDALMIFGPSSTMTFSQLSPELCRDDEWVEMRVRRMGRDDREGLMRQYCAPPPTN
jgi:hypothetical protein